VAARRPAAPGTVISVQPGGQVRTGSAVVVTGALPPHHKAKGPGQAKGPGHE
jgi:hypothetical protein